MKNKKIEAKLQITAFKVVCVELFFMLNQYLQQ